MYASSTQAVRRFGRAMHCGFPLTCFRTELLSSIFVQLNTVELIEGSSDILLKELGIKGGQIVRLRAAILEYKNQVDPSVRERCSTPSTSRSSHSGPVDRSSPLLPHTSTPLSGASRSNSPCSTHSSSPMMVFSDTASTSFGSQVSKSNTPWVQNFELPTMFSKEVTDGLQTQKMSSRVRNEFTRDVCSSIRAHTLYPTKTEREHVAMLIVKKYPFLADKLGSGIGSWEQAIKNHLKNKRKTKPTATKRSMATTKCLDQNKPKKMKSDFGKLPEMAQGETEETCKEHISALKKEMKKNSNRKMALIKNLMELTYPSRRQSILLQPMAIEELMKEYPALCLTSELKAEFDRVMGKSGYFKEMVEHFRDNWLEKILKLASAKSSCRATLQQLQEEASADDNLIESDVRETKAVVMLPILMKERAATTELLKICRENECIDEEIKASVTPRLVGAGHVGDIKPLYIVSERKILVKLNASITMANALGLLLSCFYIFNIEYPASSKNVFLFLEAAMMQQTKEAKKRVAINKFLQELE